MAHTPTYWGALRACLPQCYTVALMPEIDLQGLRRITAETMLDPRTVRRAYGGHPVTLAARASIRKAAEALNLPMPPDPVERRRGAL